MVLSLLYLLLEFETLILNLSFRWLKMRKTDYYTNIWVLCYLLTQTHKSRIRRFQMFFSNTSMRNNDPIAGSQCRYIYVPLDGSTVTLKEKGSWTLWLNNITAIIHPFLLAADVVLFNSFFSVNWINKNIKKKLVIWNW